MAVVGTGAIAKSIVHGSRQPGYSAFVLLGCTTTGGRSGRPKRGRAPCGWPATSTGFEQAREGELDYVFICAATRAEKRIVEMVNRLADTTASVYVVADLFVFDLMRAQWTTLGDLPAVSVFDTPFYGVNGWLKRVEDLVLGADSARARRRSRWRSIAVG